MREQVIRFRVNERERLKLEQLADAMAASTLAEMMRLLIDRAHDAEVLGIRRPCERQDKE